ncbi:MAG: hypothetical protein N3D82_04125 [Ignisphaera sp.]|nr:hypothetical protein [Ignisphaera sp.]MCX8168195.1 hypothetical protein [Ignisphaera sp.]MDW8084935.1 hypothetical protein [Ignisphaera sp.]
MIRLKKLYEDLDIEVFKAPTEDELERLVKESISNNGKPVSWKELRERFAGIAGEDRLRKVLVRLIERDEIIELPDGALALPGMEQNYIPRKSTKRVRPLVPSKFRARWGNIAARLRKYGKPLGEVLKEMKGGPSEEETDITDEYEEYEYSDIE